MLALDGNVVPPLFPFIQQLIQHFSESGKGNCLRDPAESTLVNHDHLRDGRLPGQRFTADQQCSYFWGRDFQVEIPNGRSYEVCQKQQEGFMPPKKMHQRRKRATHIPFNCPLPFPPPSIGYLSHPVVWQQRFHHLHSTSSPGG